MAITNISKRQISNRVAEGIAAMTMKRQCLMLSQLNIDFLHREAAKSGMSLSYLVRRILDQYETGDGKEMIVNLPESAGAGTKFVIENLTGGRLTVRTLNPETIAKREPK